MNYIRVRETAELLAVSEQTVRKLAKCGDLESVRIGKQSVRISAESVEAYLRSNVRGQAMKQKCWHVCFAQTSSTR